MVISMHSECRGSNTSSAVVFHYQSCLHDLCDEARSLPLSLCLTLSGLMHERDLHVWAATGELPFSASLYLRFDVSQQDCAVFISPLRSLFSAAATFLPPLSQCLRAARPCSTPLCLFLPRGACAWVTSPQDFLCCIRRVWFYWCNSITRGMLWHLITWHFSWCFATVMKKNCFLNAP